MLKSVIGWDKTQNKMRLFFVCSACGDVIEDSADAVAIFPARYLATETLGGLMTELDKTTVYTTHSGPCAYHARKIARETFQRVEAQSLAMFVFQLLADTGCTEEPDPRIWEEIEREMDLDYIPMSPEKYR